MQPQIEHLEDRCVPTTGLNLGTIGPLVAVDHALVTFAPPGAWASNSTDRWQLSPALSVDATILGGGQWDVFHERFLGDVDSDQSIVRFTLPDAQAVGLQLHADGTVTVYQVAYAALWSVTTTDAGQSWSGWQHVASLANPPAPSEPATDPAPFGWLANLNLPVPLDHQMGDPLPDPEPATVYGLILATEDAVRVGYEWDGQRIAGVVRGGQLSTEAVGAFWSMGEWVLQPEVWGAT